MSTIRSRAAVLLCAIASASAARCAPIEEVTDGQSRVDSAADRARVVAEDAPPVDAAVAHERDSAMDAIVTVETDAGVAMDASVARPDVTAARDAVADAPRADVIGDRPPVRPSGIPSWVTFTPTGGGVVGAIGAAPSTTQPATVREELISSTIVLRTPGIYDFGSIMHRWNGSGRCIQLENQPPILHIASSNVTVRNFAYRNAPDGIHIGAAVGAGQGYNDQPRVENIVLDHVVGYACEDALTTQYNSWNISIINSWFHGNPTVAERDKLLQLNFGNNILISGTTFVNSPRCVRFKGGARITIERSLFDGCEDAVRGDTIDVLGLIPTTQSETISRRSTYRNYNRTFSAIGRVTIISEQDNLTGGRHDQQMSGGQVIYR